MNKISRLNKSIVLAVISFLVAGYFAVDMLGNPKLVDVSYGVNWFGPTILALLLTWISINVIHYGLMRWGSNRGPSTGAINTLNIGSYAIMAIAIIFRLFWLIDLVAFGVPQIQNTGIYQLLIVIPIGLVILSSMFRIYKGKNLRDDRYRLTRNLWLVLGATFMMFSVQANFAPYTFGFYSSTNNWLGVYQNYPAYLLYAFMWAGLLGSLGVYSYLMSKGRAALPMVQEKPGKETVMTTAIVLGVTMLSFYFIDHYLVAPLYGIHAFGLEASRVMHFTVEWKDSIINPQEVIQVTITWDPSTGLEGLLDAINVSKPEGDWILGTVTADLGEGSLQILSWAMPYGATMFALSTVAALGIINVPVLKWQKEYLHSRK